LWAFNEEIVARAIHQSRIPLISAVGHEVDFTIADFVADRRAPTPSAAAEMVSGAREDLRSTVASLKGRLHQATHRGLERRRLNLERLANNKAFMVTPNKIRDLQQRFDEEAMRLLQAMRHFSSQIRQREQLLSARLNSLDLRRFILHRRDVLAHGRQRLVSAIKTRLYSERSRFGVVAGKMDALSPLAILGRGYALCRDERGAIIKKAAEVSRGDQVTVTLALGQLDCEVKKITNG
jgi:exodeoxyribonuclease VII large subunit